jgi:hypothetical protein
MTKVLTAHVGGDGILDLKVPLARGDAHKAVRVTIETLDGSSAGPPATREEWLKFIERTAGSISDPTFERQPQGE